MSAAAEDRVPLGTVMCEAGLLTVAQLEHALSVQESTGRPLGEVVVTLGYASRGAVANALAEQSGGMLRTEYGVSTGLGHPAQRQEHVLHVASPAGEALIRREGACPQEGSVIADAQGRRFRVARVALVPCAYLEPAP